MFTLARWCFGVQHGWLDAGEYGAVARRGWIGLCGYINSDGNVREVCIGTNQQDYTQYYLDRPRKIGDLWANRSTGALVCMGITAEITIAGTFFSVESVCIRFPGTEPYVGLSVSMDGKQAPVNPGAFEVIIRQAFVSNISLIFG